MFISKNINKNLLQDRKKEYQNRCDLGKTASNCDLKQGLCFIGYIVILLLDLCLIQLTISIQNILIWYLRLIIAIPIIIISVKITKKSMEMIYYRVRIPPHIITNGPFRYTRHPMYLSALLLYFSLEIATFSIIGFIYFLGVIALYSYFARYEEKHLLLEFKESYENYMNHVSRWIGFPKENL